MTVETKHCSVKRVDILTLLLYYEYNNNRRIKFKMIIGKRDESSEEKTKRHIKECEDDKIGWEYELEHAIKTNNVEYEKHCKAMIQIMTNTLNKFE